MKNCPNCGAPITGESCPYCATMFGQPPARLMIGKTIKCEFEHNGLTYAFDMLVEGFDLKAECDVSNYYSDTGLVYRAVINEGYAVAFNGHLEHKDGKFLEVRYDEAR